MSAPSDTFFLSITEQCSTANPQIGVYLPRLQKRMFLQRELFDAFQVLRQQLVLATAYSNLLKSVIE